MSTVFYLQHNCNAYIQYKIRCTSAWNKSEPQRVWITGICMCKCIRMWVKVPYPYPHLYPRKGWSITVIRTQPQPTEQMYLEKSQKRNYCIWLVLHGYVIFYVSKILKITNNQHRYLLPSCSTYVCTYSTVYCNTEKNRNFSKYSAFCTV